jgi:molybdopterin/thiamine biosynthesis adenylyltransferase
MTLTDDDLTRYARHIVLKEIGGSGQTKLKSASVAVIGAGGIGSPAIAYLAAAGVGRLLLVDDDAVDLSNLARQTIYASADVGVAKGSAARRAAPAPRRLGFGARGRGAAPQPRRRRGDPPHAAWRRQRRRSSRRG